MNLSTQNNRFIIITYSNFHDIDRREIFPEAYSVNDDLTPENTLHKIWREQINAELQDENNDLCIAKCWCSEEEGRAVMEWIDGDTKEFYIVPVHQ